MQVQKRIPWPLVSVVIPVFNGEKMLPSLLDSLKTLEYPSDRLEILLIDNNSKDGTAKLLQESGHRILFEAVPGCGTARNRGIQEARGEYIACTDVDCVLDPRWIQDLLEGFTNQQIGAVAGTIKPYRIDHPVIRYEALTLRSPSHCPEHHLFLPTACTANVMYRAEVFQQVGLLLNQSGGEEVDLNWRMQSQTPYRINFLQQGGIVYHRYREDIRSLCRSQKYKARTLVELHHRWNLKVPTGRKELSRSILSLLAFLPRCFSRVFELIKYKPITVAFRDSFLEAWLDVCVPWTRYLGIREGWAKLLDSL
ncbi:glycosyltransferase [Thermostichus vulcanus]|uniref:Glycosyltransferase n=1 Tax=Thermostichus vulcanus str. 'Rupite' TaxID=2813851 RepID=A0ABT0C6B8_THEVL|nr:glycosyltransferase [Thermostichus vulcanus]MCJ2541342.1 glycosyltransferase [Thermostichus vulcanus str. 'Rupite']